MDVWNEGESEIKKIFAMTSGVKAILWKRERWKQQFGSERMFLKEKVHILRIPAWKSSHGTK